MLSVPVAQAGEQARQMRLQRGSRPGLLAAHAGLQQPPGQLSSWLSCWRSGICSHQACGQASSMAHGCGCQRVPVQWGTWSV
jgi:hypothetical protein